MTCREFADFLADYLAGDLRPETHAAFERHLSLCVNCVRYLDQYRQTIVLGRRAFEDATAPIPEEVPDDLVRAIIAARRGA